MLPRLFHIYGPLWIHSYGVMIAIGFLSFVWLTYNHTDRVKLISGEKYLNVVFVGLLSGIIGGRLLFVANEFEYFLHHPLDIFAPWEGGFIVLGSILGVLFFVPIYLMYYQIKILHLMDLAAQYAPLMQSIARIGCLLAGCCYGMPAQTFSWTIMFTNPDGFAPLYCPLYPTQIYLALTSFGIFIFMTLLARINARKPGQLLFIYLLLESVSRFFIDFWRGDRGPISEFFFGSYSFFRLSTHQLYSAIFCAFCLFGLVIISIKKYHSTT
jgi:phosphatidylglycerol:prolipoprotein diacylglycerol transferase